MKWLCFSRLKLIIISCGFSVKVACGFATEKRKKNGQNSIGFSIAKRRKVFNYLSVKSLKGTALIQKMHLKEL